MDGCIQPWCTDGPRVVLIDVVHLYINTITVLYDVACPSMPPWSRIYIFFEDFCFSADCALHQKKLFSLVQNQTTHCPVYILSSKKYCVLLETLGLMGEGFFAHSEK